MEFEHVLKIITAVSDSELTDFSYEEDGTVIQMKKEKEQKIVTVTGVSQAPEQKTKEPESTKGDIISSPLVGIFYASATPESEPFVQVGDHVEKGQVLGIVEAMKLMNEIESDYDGVVKEILVSNEEVIEYGQPMFVIG